MKFATQFPSSLSSHRRRQRPGRARQENMSLDLATQIAALPLYACSALAWRDRRRGWTAPDSLRSGAPTTRARAQWAPREQTYTSAIGATPPPPCWRTCRRDPGAATLVDDQAS
jgi:hypothetical protein